MSCYFLFFLCPFYRKQNEPALLFCKHLGCSAADGLFSTLALLHVKVDNKYAEKVLHIDHNVVLTPAESQNKSRLSAGLR